MNIDLAIGCLRGVLQVYLREEVESKKITKLDYYLQLQFCEAALADLEDRPSLDRDGRLGIIQAIAV